MKPELEGDALSRAIADLAAGLRLSGKMNVKLKISSRKQLNALDARQKLSIYRIIQEQANNIIKYAKAANVRIDITVVSGQVRLGISDDGVGFDPEQRKEGIGFRNIASRLTLLQGSMEIHSAPGMGCRLIIGFPAL